MSTSTEKSSLLVNEESSTGSLSSDYDAMEGGSTALLRSRGGSLTTSATQNTKKIEDIGSTSFGWTILLLFKTYVGAGILGLPAAFKEGHFIASNLGIVIAAAVSLYCILLLIEVHKTMPEHVTSLEEIGREAFGGANTRSGRFMYKLVQAVIIFTQTGFSIAYVIFVANAFRALVPDMEWRFWILIFAVPFWLTTLIKQMNKLAPVAFFGFVAIFGALVAVMVYSLTTCEPNFEKHLNAEFLESFDIKTLPIYFGIVVYSFEGIGLVIPLKKAMAEPERFRTAISITYAGLVVLFCSFASVAYVAFADNVQEAIVHNLPSIGELAWLSTVVNVALSLALLLTYPLQFAPVFEIVENWLFDAHTVSLTAKRNAVRTGFALLSFVVAASVPYFSLFMSLIGNLGSSALMFILPTLFHLRTFPDRNPFVRLMHYALIVIGVCAAAIGTFTTIVALIDKFADSPMHTKMHMGGNQIQPTYACNATNINMNVTFI